MLGVIRNQLYKYLNNLLCLEAMNKKLPIIKESADLLLTKIKAESESNKRLRLQAIYLIATKQVRSRPALSQLLALHHHTIKNWLKLYEQGGLEHLLTRQPS